MVTKDGAKVDGENMQVDPQLLFQRLTTAATTSQSDDFEISSVFEFEHTTSFTIWSIRRVTLGEEKPDYVVCILLILDSPVCWFCTKLMMLISSDLRRYLSNKWSLDHICVNHYRVKNRSCDDVIAIKLGITRHSYQSPFFHCVFIIF